MKPEHGIELFAIIVMTILLWRFVPKTKMHEAIVMFLFIQGLAWLMGVVVVELHLLTYPSRLFFPHATNTSFSFEFFIYPAIGVLFNLYYPRHSSVLRRQLHYVLYCSAITGAEIWIEAYTDAIHYMGWDWYWTWFSLYLVFYSSLHFYWWFYGIKPART